MSYGSTVGPDAPVHWWRLADPGGNLAHDIGSGPQKALVLSTASNPLAYTGIASEGGSAILSGQQSGLYRTVTQHAAPYSLEVWVWRHFLSGVQEAFLSHSATLGVTAGNLFTFFSDAGNLSAAGVLADQAWHHIVGTYGVIGGAKLYVDGVNTNTVAYAGFAPVNFPLTLGVNSATTGNFSSAHFSEAAIYNVELTAARVLAHFNAGDTKAIRPVSKQSGSFDLTLGVGTFDPTALAEILAAVRKTF